MPWGFVFFSVKFLFSLFSEGLCNSDYVITSLILNISPAHLAFATRNKFQHWLSMVMGIINSPQANLRHTSCPSTVPQSFVKRELHGTGHIPCPGVWSGCTPKGSGFGKHFLQGQSSHGKPRHRQFPGYKVFVFHTEHRFLLVRYRGRRLWGIISLSQHILLIIITSALHIACHLGHI